MGTDVPEAAEADDLRQNEWVTTADLVNEGNIEDERCNCLDETIDSDVQRRVLDSDGRKRCRRVIVDS